MRRRQRTCCRSGSRTQRRAPRRCSAAARSGFAPTPRSMVTWHKPRALDLVGVGTPPRFPPARLAAGPVRLRARHPLLGRGIISAMRSAPDGSCATRCHVVPPSASLRPSHAAGCRLLPRFWRRFQRPPRVGLNPARLRGIRTLAQRLGAAAITGFFAFRSVLGLIKRSIRPSRTWRAGTRRTGSVPSPRACSPCRGAWSFRSASKRRLPLRAAQTLSPEIERRDRQCDASLASRVAPTPAKPRKLRPYVIDILVQSRRNRRAAKRTLYPQAVEGSRDSKQHRPVATAGSCNARIQLCGTLGCKSSIDSRSKCSSQQMRR